MAFRELMRFLEEPDANSLFRRLPKEIREELIDVLWSQPCVLCVKIKQKRVLLEAKGEESVASILDRACHGRRWGWPIFESRHESTSGNWLAPVFENRLLDFGQPATNLRWRTGRLRPIVVP